MLASPEHEDGKQERPGRIGHQLLQFLRERRSDIEAFPIVI